LIKAQEWSTARAVEEDSFVKRAQKCVQNVFKKVFLVNPTFCFIYIYTKCKKWGWLWRGFLCEKSAEMCVCVSVTKLYRQSSTDKALPTKLYRQSSTDKAPLPIDSTADRLQCQATPVPSYSSADLPQCRKALPTKLH
jgi:hypothetical protein